LETYFHEEKYGFLVVPAFNKKCYGFNLTRANERANTMQIILDKNNFIVSGWKVARKLPNWIHNAHEWNEFFNRNCSDDSPCKNADNNEDNFDNNDNDDGKENDKNYGNDNDDDNSVGEEEDDNNAECVESNDEEDIKAKSEKDEDTFNSINGGDLKEKMFEYVAEHFKSEDEEVFKSICGGDLKKKLSQKLQQILSSQTQLMFTSLDRFTILSKVTGLLCIVTMGRHICLKAQFILLYVSCLLRVWQKVTKSNLNIDHCKTYYKISICKYQFSPENLWKHCQSGKPVKNISFVYSCDKKEGTTAGKEDLVEAIKFFFMSTKKRDNNPIVPLLLEHLHEKSGRTLQTSDKRFLKLGLGCREDHT
jgi:hypothetical protein